MRKQLILGASLLILGSAALAEPIREAVFMQCKNHETGEVVGAITVTKSGLRFTVLDASQDVSWEQIDLLRKVSDELAP